MLEVAKETGRFSERAWKPDEEIAVCTLQVGEVNVSISNARTD